MKSFIKKFNGIGWIPSIKGCFSLNAVVKMNEFNYGVFDKYSIVFTVNNDGSDKHYFVATSVIKTTDKIGGVKYGRLYRCIFMGVVGDKKIINSDNFYKNKCKYILDNDICVGDFLMYFIDDTSIEYESKESEFLHKLNELEAEIKNNLHNSDVRNKYITKWNELRCIFNELSDVDSSRKPTKLERIFFNLKDNILFKKNLYKIALYRDGIILINKLEKNANNSQINDDDKENVLSLDYQMVFLFLKHVFHCDYHHNRSTDDILQIFSCKDNLIKFYSAQLSLLLDIVVDAKRFIKTQVNVEPLGIISYAKSFVLICSNKGIINEKEEEYQLKLINNMSNEIEIHNTLKERYYNKWFFDGGMTRIIILFIMPLFIAEITLLTFYGNFFKEQCWQIILFIYKVCELHIFKQLLTTFGLCNIFLAYRAFLIVTFFICLSFFIMYIIAKYRYFHYSKKAQLDTIELESRDKYRSTLFDNVNYKYRKSYKYMSKYLLENLLYILINKKKNRKSSVLYYKYLLKCCLYFFIVLLLIIGIISIM